MSDITIRNARLPEVEHTTDLLVRKGIISAIDQNLPISDNNIHADGALLIPGFVESHVHLDKACILDRCHNNDGTLAGAIASVAAAKQSFTVDDVYKRGSDVLKKAIVQGTNLIRTHVEIDPAISLAGFEAVLQLKQDFAWAVELQICVFPQEGMTNYPGTQELLEKALNSGADLLGGCPYTDTDPHAQIRILFEMAVRYNVDLDFHLDFDLDSTWRHLDAIAEQTIAHGWQGRVAIGHVTKLSALANDQLMDTVALLKQADIALTVLPATDLFLMGREHNHLIPRGVAPAHVFLANGVCSTIASNNILNPFTPYGDCSLSRMANLYANIHQLGSQADLDACFVMVTSAPEDLINQRRKLGIGEEATCIALPALNGSQVVSEITRPLWGMKRGRTSFEHKAARLFSP